MRIKKRILLSDDPELLQALRNSFFARNGFSLLVADSEHQAFATIEERDPALVILDLDRPGFRGDICCRRVKQDPVLRSTPVILLARPDNQEELARCREAGCDAIIEKPISNRNLLASACRLLNIAERAEPRVSIELTLACGCDPRKLRPVRILNMNAGGVFIETDRLHPADTLLVVEFTLPRRRDPIRGKGRVAWVNHPEWLKSTNLPIGMGIQFLDLEPAQVAAIREFYDRLLAAAAEGQPLGEGPHR